MIDPWPSNDPFRVRFEVRTHARSERSLRIGLNFRGRNDLCQIDLSNTGCTLPEASMFCRGTSGAVKSALIRKVFLTALDQLN